MTLRIIAGTRRGTFLATPPGLATRPTLGRVRGSLFNILLASLPGARVLDCFAGCGALGFEALSRGALHATLIEEARPALASIATNLAKLKWQECVRVIPRDALGCLREAAPPGGEPFDIIFLDPPYGLDFCHKALKLLGERTPAWLASGGVIAVQHGREDQVRESYGPLLQLRLKDYGETRIAFYGSPE